MESADSPATAADGRIQTPFELIIIIAVKRIMLIIVLRLSDNLNRFEVLN